MGPFHEQFTKEALKAMDGLILPVTIEVNGEKRTVGVAALSYVDGSVHVAGEITDPRVAEIMMTEDVAYFSAPKLPGMPATLRAKWQEGLTDS